MSTYTVRRTGETTNSWPQFGQILTDFQNLFTGRFIGKFAVKWLLKSHHTWHMLPHYSEKNENRLRFDSIIATRLWSHFFWPTMCHTDRFNNTILIQTCNRYYCKVKCSTLSYLAKKCGDLVRHLCTRGHGPYFLFPFASVLWPFCREMSRKK